MTRAGTSNSAKMPANNGLSAVGSLFLQKTSAQSTWMVALAVVLAVDTDGELSSEDVATHIYSSRISMRFAYFCSISDLPPWQDNMESSGGGHMTNAVQVHVAGADLSTCTASHSRQMHAQLWATLCKPRQGCVQSHHVGTCSCVPAALQTVSH